MRDDRANVEVEAPNPLANPSEADAALITVPRNPPSRDRGRVRPRHPADRSASVLSRRQAGRARSLLREPSAFDYSSYRGVALSY